MRFQATIAASLLVACTSDEAMTDTAPPDSDETGETESLWGERVDPQPLPQFEATHFDGTARGPEDLRGKATVLWFYPNAAGDN